MPPKNLRQIQSSYQLNPEDPFSCIMGLSPLDVRVYVEILAGANTVELISTQIGKTKSTTQRVLSKLLDLGIVKRQSSSGDESVKQIRRGYIYVYEPLTVNQTKSVLLENLEITYNKMKDYLDSHWTSDINKQVEDVKQKNNSD